MIKAIPISNFSYENKLRFVVQGYDSTIGWADSRHSSNTYERARTHANLSSKKKGGKWRVSINKTELKNNSDSRHRLLYRTAV